MELTASFSFKLDNSDATMQQTIPSTIPSPTKEQFLSPNELFEPPHRDYPPSRNPSLFQDEEEDSLDSMLLSQDHLDEIVEASHEPTVDSNPIEPMIGTGFMYHKLLFSDNDDSTTTPSPPNVIPLQLLKKTVLKDATHDHQDQTTTTYDFISETIHSSDGGPAPPSEGLHKHKPFNSFFNIRYSPSHGALDSPSVSYGIPKSNPSISYGTPEGPLVSYETPDSPSASYGTPEGPPVSYGTLDSPPVSYEIPDSTPLVSHGPPDSTSIQFYEHPKTSNKPFPFNPLHDPAASYCECEGDFKPSMPRFPNTHNSKRRPLHRLKKPLQKLKNIVKTLFK